MATLRLCYWFSEGSITVCSNSMSQQQAKLTFCLGHQGFAILIQTSRTVEKSKVSCRFTEEELKRVLQVTASGPCLAVTALCFFDLIPR